MSLTQEAFFRILACGAAVVVLAAVCATIDWSARKRGWKPSSTDPERSSR